MSAAEVLLTKASQRADPVWGIILAEALDSFETSASAFDSGIGSDSKWWKSLKPPPAASIDDETLLMPPTISRHPSMAGDRRRKPIGVHCPDGFLPPFSQDGCGKKQFERLPLPAVTAGCLYIREKEFFYYEYRTKIWESVPKIV